MKAGDVPCCGFATTCIEQENSSSFCSFLSFFPCISVGKPATYTHFTLSIGVELVGAISVLGDCESDRCEVADMESSHETIPHPTTTLAIYAVTSVVNDHINLAHF